jgi:hypothetical protein
MVDDGYVPHGPWKKWKERHPDFFNDIPKHEFIVTTCELGIPARDVERWLCLATGIRPSYEWD